ncbi:adhesion G protein-coupled receptor F4 [Vanacampus margaritifer]
MLSTMLVYLMGSFYMYYQAYAAGTTYVAELLVKSNVTLQAQTIISVLNGRHLQVADDNGAFYTVTLDNSEMIAECQIIGDEYACNCSDGYTWSNEVCYKLSCCSETTCKHDVFKITPVCVAKVQGLNGFEGLNITSLSLANSSVDFEVDLSVKFEMSKLQGIVSDLEASLGAVFRINSVGMVTIEPTEPFVPYKSESTLKCTLEEASNSSGWKFSRLNECYDLNNGGVVKVNSSCATNEYKSCTVVTLQSVTSLWAGMYECEFTSGSFRHMATTELRVAALPEDIIMTSTPVTVDCSQRQWTDNVTANITATMDNNNETYGVTWSYKGIDHLTDTASIGRLNNGGAEYGPLELNVPRPPRDKGEVLPEVGFETPSDRAFRQTPFREKASTVHIPETDMFLFTATVDSLGYTFKAVISCQKTIEAHYVNITFKNVKDQHKSARLDIPVIYENDTFCKEDGDSWPKTPDGDTIIKQICPEGRVGYESRTCKGNTWQPVYSKCVINQVFNLMKAAEKFLKGPGATPEAAKDIFRELQRCSMLDSNSSGRMADLTASIHILELMAKASESVTLQSSVLPDFIQAASNMLDKTWDAVNNSITHDLSSNYLGSVESLVKNIQISIDQTNVTTHNLDLKFCQGGNCKVTLFNRMVNMSRSSGLLKIFGVKNLTDKLLNNFPNTTPSPVLISATLEDKEESSLRISLDFFEGQQKAGKTLCVFWNTTRGWSEEGCTATSVIGNNIFCVCNHLTAFSALWGVGDKSSQELDRLTIVGLCVSICSVLIFLISQFLVWSAVVKTNLSHFYHTVMVNIAVFLLLAHCSFLISSYIDLSVHPPWCDIVTVCKHFFFLAKFCWMLCMSILLVHHLVFVFHPVSRRLFMFLSCMVGYVCPTLIVGSTYMYCKNSNKPYHDKNCWLVPGKGFLGSLSSFLLPIGTITLINLCCMVVVIATLVRSPVLDGSKADHKETAKSILKAVAILTPIFGLTWIAGYFYYMPDLKEPFYTIVDYSFCLLNSFQGLSILLSGCFAEQKVREELLRLIRVKSKRRHLNLKTSTTFIKGK